MTKSYFMELADYNIWANDIVHSWFEKISDEQWHQPIVSSFKSLAETSLHTAGAETIWLDRLNKVAQPRWLPNIITNEKKDVQDAWKKSSSELRSFIENFDETNMQDEISFMRPDNKTYKLMPFQIFAHVFNHSTYHRGQMVTMLRQVDFTEVRSTDMSTFFWNQKK